MKKLLLTISVLAFATSAAAQSELPFVGQRTFTFEYGKDLETITIAPNGQTKILTGKTHYLGADKILYQGEYQTYLPVKNGFYQVKGNKIYALDERKEPADCGVTVEEGHCAADLQH